MSLSRKIKITSIFYTLLIGIVLFAFVNHNETRPKQYADTTIWQPALNTSWQWQLTTPVDQSVDVQMYDIDGFDNDTSVVSSLHAKGRKVICYIDAGTFENWRSDAGQFPSSVKGSGVSGWQGEQWLDIRNLAVLEPIMQTRMQMCKTKGFDGIEFDNVDGYTNNTGFTLSSQDQLTYNEWLATQAHSLGLSVGLKNDLDQIPQLLTYFDWALDEQCFEYNECDKLTPFVSAGKAVFEVEYNLQPSQFCDQANTMNFNSLFKNLNLDATRTACRTTIVTNTLSPTISSATSPTTNPLTVTPTVTGTTSSSLSFNLTICPHGVGNCGDNVKQGGSGNMSPVHTTRQATIHIFDSNNTQVIAIPGTVSYDNNTHRYKGNLSTTTQLHGNYLIQIKMDGYLSRSVSGIQQINQGQSITLPETFQVTGDINNDNQLDIQDYNLLINCYGSKQTTTSCLNPPNAQTQGADINDDGKIDAVDYNLFLRELSVQQGM